MAFITTKIGERILGYLVAFGTEFSLPLKNQVKLSLQGLAFWAQTLRCQQCRLGSSREDFNIKDSAFRKLIFSKSSSVKKPSSNRFVSRSVA